MIIDTLWRLLLLLALSLSQALVFNHIHFFGCAMPLLYVYMIIIMPRGYPRWATLLWSFSLGLIVDLFANTPGVNAASLTMTGFLQPYVLESFMPRESPDNMKTSVATLGHTRFYTLALILTFVHCLMSFTLEMFSVFDWLMWALSIVCSTVLTLILMFALESVRPS